MAVPHPVARIAMVAAPMAARARGFLRMAPPRPKRIDYDDNPSATPPKALPATIHQHRQIAGEGRRNGPGAASSHRRHSLPHEGSRVYNRARKFSIPAGEVGRSHTDSV